MLQNLRDEYKKAGVPLKGTPEADNKPHENCSAPLNEHLRRKTKTAPVKRTSREDCLSPWHAVLGRVSQRPEDGEVVQVNVRR